MLACFFLVEVILQSLEKKRILKNKKPWELLFLISFQMFNITGLQISWTSLWIIQNKTTIYYGTGRQPLYTFIS